MGAVAALDAGTELAIEWTVEGVRGRVPAKVVELPFEDGRPDITRELEVDRMKSEFLSMAAHELRTPMASIFGFTELLLRRLSVAPADAAKLITMPAEQIVEALLRPASMMAYLADFRVMTLVTVVIIPLLFFMRRQATYARPSRR